MVKGAVFFDYDGTLVDEREAIYTPTKRTMDVIRELQHNGYLCVLATGRALNYVPAYAKKLGMDGFICSNGAYVKIHDQCIFRDVFDKEEVCSLMRSLDAEHINYFLESSETCYVKDKEEHFFRSFADNFKVPLEGFADLPDTEDFLGQIEKITILPSAYEDTKRWMQALQDRYECCRHRHTISFDIGKKHMHKGVGVDAVLAYFAIPFTDTYAFGDGTNDIGLLKHVCHGIAMEAHAKELDAYAEMITASVKDEGIYHALKKLEVIA